MKTCKPSNFGYTFFWTITVQIFYSFDAKKLVFDYFHTMTKRFHIIPYIQWSKPFIGLLNSFAFYDNKILIYIHTGTVIIDQKHVLPLHKPSPD